LIKRIAGYPFAIARFLKKEALDTGAEHIILEGKGLNATLPKIVASPRIPAIDPENQAPRSTKARRLPTKYSVLLRLFDRITCWKSSRRSKATVIVLALQKTLGDPKDMKNRSRNRRRASLSVDL
jgi:hypothetical protein